jgi:hypothetical protein
MTEENYRSLSDNNHADIESNISNYKAAVIITVVTV